MRQYFENAWRAARRASGALLALGLWWPIQSSAETLHPDTALIQLGTAGSTHAATVGLGWGWGKQWTFGRGRVSGSWEGSLSAWSYPKVPDGRRTAWLAQVALIPVVRYQHEDFLPSWFAEAGIGVTLTSALYESERKRFSTAFNFGDQLAIGRTFGDRRQHELSVRVEHYSNGAIKHPNPGINFVQLRYAYALP